MKLSELQDHINSMAKKVPCILEVKIEVMVGRELVTLDVQDIATRLPDNAEPFVALTTS